MYHDQRARGGPTLNLTARRGRPGRTAEPGKCPTTNTQPAARCTIPAGAGMAKLVDAADLKSADASLAGSIPAARTMNASFLPVTFLQLP